jgi:hypothetical protein
MFKLSLTDILIIRSPMLLHSVFPGHVARGERRLQVVTAGIAVDIDHFTAEKKFFDQL